MILDPNLLSSIFLGLSAWGGAFVAALWLSLIIWTYRDIKSRGKDPIIRFLAVLVVGVLFLPGIVIYLILRPPYTLEEEYQHTLEEEALLRSIEEASTCPGCGRHTRDDWLVCPHCHTKQKKPCHHCGYLMDLAWNLCPHCGTPAPGMRREGDSMDEALHPLALNLRPPEIDQDYDDLETVEELDLPPLEFESLSESEGES